MKIKEQQQIIRELLKTATYSEIGGKVSVCENTVRRWHLGKHQAHRLFIKELKRLLIENQLKE